MMMRHVFSDQLGDFATLYEDVELISVRRPPAMTKARAFRVEQWMTEGGEVDAHWTQPAGKPDVAEEMLRPIDDPELRADLGEEISQAVVVLTDLLNCNSVGIRIATLRGPMCPRFHADLVPCRMLITLSGPGTEWIAHDDVDFEYLADRSADRVPVLGGAQVRTLQTGAWSLLKGGRWKHPFNGVVHRSPHTDLKRLLVSLDPMFSR